MADNPRPSLSEALTKFVTAKKNGKKAQDGHQELSRFVAWCGRDRTVVELEPSDIAEYAQHIGLRGGDPAQRLTPVKAFLSYWKDEGWIQTGLSAHLRVPRTRRNTAKKSGSATTLQDGGTQLSQEGFDRLVSQLEGFKGERISVVEDIKLAMADKDFRENAPLDAAKERQGFIEAKIRELEAGLASAQIISDRNKKGKRSVIGTKMTIKDEASGKKVIYTLVDVREADIATGKISVQSPVGQALLNKTIGDKIAVTVPKGTVTYIVEKVGG